jgi:hypothetical protein
VGLGRTPVGVAGGVASAQAVQTSRTTRGRALLRGGAPLNRSAIMSCRLEV